MQNAPHHTDSRSKTEVEIAAPDPGFEMTEFDEKWYLGKYPDVLKEFNKVNGPLSGHIHYQRHGKREAREARYITSKHPLFHLHIPKTAGSSLRVALARHKLNILRVEPSFSYVPAKHGTVDVFTGHAGFRVLAEDTALRLRGVTILRDPVDRLVSYYYHLIKLHDEGSEISNRTIPARKYRIDDFFRLKDNPHLIADMFNAMTWQLLYGADLKERIDYRHANPALSDSELVARAVKNLSKFALVGFQDRIENFAASLNALCGLDLTLRFENTNRSRLPIEDISSATRSKIEEWAYADISLYKIARAQFLTPA